MATSGVTWQFLLASAAVIVTPGPDIAFLTSILIRTRSSRPALQAAGGMILGGAGHALLGFGGMTLVISSHPDALRWLRSGGAVILAGYGLVMFSECIKRSGRTRAGQPGRPGPAGSEPAARPVRHPVLAGFACTAANPKVGLFLVAFLPQFIPRNASAATALPLLAGVYLGLGMLWLVIWICLVGRLRQASRFDRIRPAIEIVTGTGLLVFAARLAMG